MRYFIINGSSPHSSMWETSGGDLRFAGELSPANLIGIRFEKSALRSPVAREKISERFPEITIPPFSEDGNIKEVRIGEHIICICTRDGKFVSPKKDDNKELIIKDYVVVSK